MQMIKELDAVLAAHPKVKRNLTRQELIRTAVDGREAIVSANGALATWTPRESTGRSPSDTLIVLDSRTASNIDWDSPNNLPVSTETYDMLWQDALDTLREKKKIFVTRRAVGADPEYSLPVTTVTDRSLTALFTMNMFRSIPENIGDSVFAERGFTILVLPYDKLDRSKFRNRLRVLPNGDTSDMAIVMDFGKRTGLIYGSAYGGSVKKLIFAVMNYYLPLEDILPLHCSANEGEDGSMALFLGLSGTGKTTLSADPLRALLGDDEHGWSNNGIANFENGCYAKLIDLNPEKEPEIHNAVFHKAKPEDHGAIIENAMMYPDGTFDLCDDRLTPNSRVSYPLSFLTNIKPSSTGDHPRYIIFLTADANGVLPPVARLNTDQAMLWFLMGYTSKLAGTETGIVDPVSTFSRFFGQPFMPCLPNFYSDLLGSKMKEHDASVYLINTGWSGGPYGVGRRMDISLTRGILTAVINGHLEDAQFKRDHLFHLDIPIFCPGVPSEILTPENTWGDKDAYRERAQKLANDFSQHFDKAYGNKNIPESVRNICPGK
ncbi:MAG: phosphoenolpyruvate carboxykinase (ATP) [Desulfobacterales bacterium]|nr:MAG: phosphoenolpyruvate carboxykinase (ATP) [Desulfobacterales bacterium]